MGTVAAVFTAGRQSFTNQSTAALIVPANATMAGRTIFCLSLLLIVTGLIWVAQGSGYFPYPAESFMIDQRPWIFGGALTAACGLALLLWSR
jgi:hypothetical protein